MADKFIYYVRVAFGYWLTPLLGTAGGAISGLLFKAEIFIVITSVLTGMTLGYILTEAMRMKIPGEHQTL